MKLLNSQAFKILVVDDDTEIIAAYEKVLTPLNKSAQHQNLTDIEHRLFGLDQEKSASQASQFELTKCQDGRTALDAVKRACDLNEPFQVLFLDLNLAEGENGVDLAEKIRNIDGQIEIVIVTGYMDMDPEEIAVRVPPLNKLFYFQKPFQVLELRHLSRALGQKWKAEEELQLLHANLEDIVASKTEELSSAVKEVEAAKDVAVTANLAKSEFLAMMSHEMRTPLNSICGFSDIILAQSENEELRSFVLNIQNAGQELLSMVNDVLDFSNMERGKVQAEKEPFHLLSLVDGCRQKASQSAKLKKLEFVCRLDPQLPKMVLGSEGSLVQLLNNLLSNAIKFTPQGTVTLSVELIEASDERFTARFSVKDTGIGIEQARLKAIFSPFQQVESSNTRRYGGIGLGLSISKELVQALGGELRVESEPEVGSDFSFEIPFVRYSTEPKKAEQEGAPVTQIPSVVEMSESKSDGILIVEDNPTNQFILKTVLKKQGFSADVAENGVQAINKISDKTYSLIFMDCQMPVMDGLETTQRIRQMGIDEETTQIFAITANADPENREKCFESGMDGYICKPFKISEIQSVLQSVGLLS